MRFLTKIRFFLKIYQISAFKICKKYLKDPLIEIYLIFAILEFVYSRAFYYCGSFAFWVFTASYHSRSAFRVVSNFYAVYIFGDVVKIGDDAKRGAVVGAKVKHLKCETSTV